jgi:DNA-binding LacI/PurR family transcriptional regulator
MADVAERAGVSHQTVSRVVNDTGLVKPSTREKILRAIDELGYRRNSSARALATHHSGLIGVIVAELWQYGPASAVVGIADAARAAGYTATVDPIRGSNGGALERAVDHMLSQRVEGIVLVTPDDESHQVLHTLGGSVPIVGLHSSSAEPSTSVDQSAGARLATQHLLDLGHTRITHVAGPLAWTEARERRDGFVGALADAGLEPVAVLEGDWSAASGRALVDGVLAGDPTAVFVGNDQMAIGLVHALTGRGVGVPQDLSVVGFDDVPESEFYAPPLTTVRQDFAAVGAATLAQLLAQIRGEDSASVPVTPELVVRESTGRPRRRRSVLARR